MAVTQLCFGGLAPKSLTGATDGHAHFRGIDTLLLPPCSACHELGRRVEPITVAYLQLCVQCSLQVVLGLKAVTAINNPS